MGVEQLHVVQHERRVFAASQSALDTPVRPTSADAIKVISFDHEWDQERYKRQHNRTTQGRRGAVTGADKVSWSMEVESIPSGTAGTPPDDFELRRALFGTQTIVGATSVTYVPLNSQQVRVLTLTDHQSLFLMYQLVAAWVTNWKLTADGTNPIRETFSGGARRRILTMQTQLNGAISAVDDIVIDDADHLMVGSVIQFGASGNDNTGTGFGVTAKVVGATAATIEANATAADNVAIYPFSPSETTAGRPLSGIEGSVTVDGVSYLISKLEIEGERNMQVHDGDFGQEHVSDVNPGWREFKGSVSFRCRRDVATLLAARENGGYATQPIVVTMGSTAGRTRTITIPRAEFVGAAKVEHSQDNAPSTVTLAWEADESTDTSVDAISDVWT